MEGSKLCIQVSLKMADIIERQRLDDNAYEKRLSRQETRTTDGRTLAHTESCTCGVQPVRRIATTTTEGSRTLRDDISFASSTFSRVQSPVVYQRKSSTTAPSGLGIDTLRNLSLDGRSHSNAATESRYTVSGESLDKVPTSTIVTGAQGTILE